MRFTHFRSQRNATGIFSKSEVAIEQPPGERERVATLSHPVPEGV